MTRTRRLLAVASCAVACALAAKNAYAARPITLKTLAAFQAWVDAVRTHTAGRHDASVDAVSSYSLETREELDSVMPSFVQTLFTKGGNLNANPAVSRLIDLAKSAGDQPDAPTFIKRAAILHSDAAMFADRYDPADLTRSNVRQGNVRIDPRSGLPVNITDQSRVHPLLSHRAIYTDKDGQLLANSFASWQWPFARWLLDSLAGPTVDPFVGPWYHATTAFMFAKGLYAEATPHLQRAGEILPDNALILFDRGCYSEILGLPMHQVLLPEETDAQHALHYTSGLGWRATNGATTGIPRLAVTNAEAERLFRRALTFDPDFIEARVRLGRLLTVRRRFDEAASELTAALELKPTDPIVAFYADVFAGRAVQALGRGGDAARYYHDALALFPDAQSALLGLSYSAILIANVSAALEPVDRLGPQTARPDADPWWIYQLGAGRAFDTLLDDAWDTVRPQAPRSKVR